MAYQNQIASGVQSGGNAGGLASMIQGIGGMFNKGGGTPAPSATQSTAIDRAVDAKSQDPMVKVHQGLDVVNDPDFPMPYEDRMHIADKLLRAKHGMDDGEWQPPEQGAQGQIASGKQQSGNASGIIGTIASIV